MEFSDQAQIAGRARWVFVALISARKQLGRVAFRLRDSSQSEGVALQFGKAPRFFPMTDYFKCHSEQARNLSEGNSVRPYICLKKPGWTFRHTRANLSTNIFQKTENDMKTFRVMFRSILASYFFVALAACSQAQSGKADYQPQVGQEGKDVIWVPTPQSLVDKMLDIAKVTPKDYLIDLGSGDGRTVITAAKRGVKALGIEYNPDMVELSKRNAAKEGVGERASFTKADLFETDFSEATVITMFLLPDINLKLRPKILNLKPGTRIVSNSFTMGDWKADDSVMVKDGCVSYCTAYLWIVPAKVEGNWQLGDGELALKQTYQMISGALRRAGKTVQISNGKLNGGRITFNAAGSVYDGRVTGNGMEGTISSGGNWTASRSGK
jgi:methyltransferase family protein